MMRQKTSPKPTWEVCHVQWCKQKGRNYKNWEGVFNFTARYAGRYTLSSCVCPSV